MYYFRCIQRRSQELHYRKSVDNLKLLLVYICKNKIGTVSTWKMPKEKVEYPSDLKGFGYGFNEEGKMRQLDKETGKLTDKAFDFNVYTSATKNQEHYEALGEVITQTVYKLLKKEGLHKLYIPEDVPKKEATFIFSTQEKLQAPKKLLILIHGSGVVRAGQWARSLIINDCLDSGTQIPYIKKARELGYEVLVLNTNDNHRTINGTRQPIKDNRSPTEHAATVFKKYVLESGAESVGIVAHSFGGVVAVELAQKYPDFFKEKVFAVGLTDSVHSPNLVPELMIHIGRNWVSSKNPVDSLVHLSSIDIPRHSAGHIKHEMTSYSCMDALFNFFEDRYTVFKKEPAPDAKKMKTDL